MSQPFAVAAADDALKRRLSLADAVATLVGIILGSGIFVAPAAIARVAPTATWAVILWLAGGLVALCGALCYAECGARLPHDGGFYVFYREALGPAWGFVGGWAGVAITYPASLASIALVGAHYLGEAAPDLAGSQQICALVALSGAALLNLLGVRLGAWTQKVLSSAKVGALGAVCIAALWTSAPEPSSAARAAVEPVNLMACLAALTALTWTFDGWTDATLIAGELRDPNRNLGRAAAWAIGIVAALYALVQIAVMHMLPATEAAASTQVLAAAVERGFGSGASRLVALLVVLCTAGAVHGTMLVSSRLPFAMAEGGSLPRLFAAVHPRFGTPARSIGLMYALSVVCVLVASFNELLSFFSFAIWLFYGLTAVVLLRLRWRAHHDVAASSQTWEAPGGVLAPIVLLCVAAVMTVLQFMEDPARSAAGLAVLTAGLPLHHLWSSRLKR